MKEQNKRQIYPRAIAPKWPDDFDKDLGVDIPDIQINEWLEKMAESLRGEGPYEIRSTRSGNTLVYRSIDEYGTIRFFVCKRYAVSCVSAHNPEEKSTNDPSE